MPYPAPDGDTLRAWALGEVIGDLTIVDNLPASRTYHGFVDSVAADNMSLFDTLPGSADSQHWDVGVPGVFGHRAMAFYRGTDPDTRDYLFGSSSPEPTGPMTMWGLVQPYSFTTPAQTILHKERSPTVWNAPTYSAQLFIGAGTGEWGTRVTIGGVDFLLVVGSGDNNNHLKMRLNAFNLIGMTHDGSVLRTYINGFVGPTLAAVGTIDWGTHGLWVMGGSRAIGAAALDAMNAAIQEMRIEQVARPASYFFDAYMVLAAEGGTGPPVVAVVTALDATHLQIVFDTPMTTTSEFVRAANYQVRGSGTGDLVVSAVTVIDSVTARLTVSEMSNGATYQALIANLLKADSTPTLVSSAPFTGVGAGPGIVLVSPTDGSIDVARSTDIVIEITDLDSGVDLSTISTTIEATDAFVDGAFVAPYNGPRSRLETIAHGYRITIDPTPLFAPGQVVDIEVIAVDNAGNGSAPIFI
jgi:hypothetical protein